MSTLKRTVKAVLRPFVRPLLVRIEELGRRIDETNDLAVRLDRHLPIIENAIESQNAGLREEARHNADNFAQLERLREELARTQHQIEVLPEELAMSRGSSSLAVSTEGGVSRVEVCARRGSPETTPVDVTSRTRLNA